MDRDQIKIEKTMNPIYNALKEGGIECVLIDGTIHIPNVKNATLRIHYRIKYGSYSYQTIGNPYVIIEDMTDRKTSNKPFRLIPSILKCVKKNLNDQTELNSRSAKWGRVVDYFNDMLHDIIKESNDRLKDLQIEDVWNIQYVQGDAMDIPKQTTMHPRFGYLTILCTTGRKKQPSIQIPFPYFEKTDDGILNRRPIGDASVGIRGFLNVREMDIFMAEIIKVAQRADLINPDINYNAFWEEVHDD